MYEQPDTSPELTALAIEEDRREDTISFLAQTILKRREAERLANALESPWQSPVYRNLAQELALPDDEQAYAITGLLPDGGNALFAGRYKAGKTTFNGNLIRAWVDHGHFLGRFECLPDKDRPVVTIFNYEMTEGQFRRWMRRMSVRNQGLVNVVHLRGKSLPFAFKDARNWTIEHLKQTSTGLWILDPASKAMVGSGDPTDNNDVAMFTSTLDEIKREAGVRDLVLNVHMPHGANRDDDTERAFGAQAWSAWADALWFLTIDKNQARWFRAEGRDVDVERQAVHYDPADMNVTLTDVNPEIAREDKIRQVVLGVIRDQPGINKRHLRDHVRLLAKCSQLEVSDTIATLLNEGVIMTAPGPNRQFFHYLAADRPVLGELPDHLPGGTRPESENGEDVSVRG